MDNLEEELKAQKEKLAEIEKDIKTIKKVYFTGLIFKLVIIVLPIIGLILSIPKILELYEQVGNTAL